MRRYPELSPDNDFVLILIQKRGHTSVVTNKIFHPQLVIFKQLQFAPPRIGFWPVLRRLALNLLKNSCAASEKFYWLRH